MGVICSSDILAIEQESYESKTTLNRYTYFEPLLPQVPIPTRVFRSLRIGIKIEMSDNFWRALA